MLNKQDWFLVANGANAKLFRYKEKKLDLIKEFHSNAAQLRTQELGEDRPGRVIESQKNSTKHTIEPKADIQTKEKQEFIKNILKFTDQQAYLKKFEQLILIASPEVLGEIRVDLSKYTKSLIKKEIDKDLVYMSNKEILEHLIKYTI